MMTEICHMSYRSASRNTFSKDPKMGDPSRDTPTFPPAYTSAVDAPNVPISSPADEPRKFDSTGMFHWCPDHPIHEIIMVSKLLAFYRRYPM